MSEAAKHTVPLRWRVYQNTISGSYHVRRGDKFLTTRNGTPRSFSTLASAQDAAAKANAKATGSTQA